MKNTIWLLVLLLISTACSTSKTIPSQWMSNEFKETPFDRMLVFANTEDKVLQDRFEDKMATVLVSEGITPVKMHELFPEVEYKEDYSQEEIDNFVQRCTAKDIDKVLVASQKSMTVDTVLAKNLRNYFNSLEPLSLSHKKDEDLVYDKKELTTYTIEAAVYDIAVTTEDKPIATTTLKVTDPKSNERIENRFLKEIEKLFKNR
ncbi:hypothetical protein [Marinirhabdus gelatinilytica]|uniref:Uncharacterized protein n=1 Tax=Marinirhabdus gelatinilytica TaxID=1703343 RepID=A0A370QLX8_9FLAO|nr:hypothetical protein [Marinirhabdus gelatinilytica]RDK89020.1 hypothetical protein C8D94_101899 [Marinirhabdus gelatinilytica]